MRCNYREKKKKALLSGLSLLDLDTVINEQRGHDCCQQQFDPVVFVHLHAPPFIIQRVYFANKKQKSRVILPDIHDTKIKRIGLVSSTGPPF